ncbi:uncharacterized protein METZ01_LOCUS447692, partial [marine metagenome]
VIATTGKPVKFQQIGINDEFSHVVGGHEFQRKKFMLDKKPSLKFIE